MLTDKIAMLTNNVYKCMPVNGHEEFYNDVRQIDYGTT